MKRNGTGAQAGAGKLAPQLMGTWPATNRPIELNERTALIVCNDVATLLAQCNYTVRSQSSLAATGDRFLWHQPSPSCLETLDTVINATILFVEQSRSPID
ncbi:jg4051 [Pararge aegeria aegeria]|uniref:Jg4051 protein n=1 Tax=Pararge aegeria aegeria TaxID=348720 RepID=A0A8S4R971_9NEOP|nr:jg4051 [Pararge aegeria aegeria]